MDGKDFPIFSVEAHHKAIKDKAVHARAIEIAAAMAQFLDENSLTKKPLLTAEKRVDVEFKIWASDLTDLGRAVIYPVLERWEKSVWSSKGLVKTNLLEKSLAEQLAKRN